MVSLLNVDDRVRTCVGGPVDNADGDTDSRTRDAAKFVALCDNNLVALVDLSWSLLDVIIVRFNSLGRKCS